MAAWREGAGGAFWLGDPGTVASPGRAATVFPVQGGGWEWSISNEAGGKARTAEEAKKAAEKAFGPMPPSVKARASVPPLRTRRATVAPPKPPKRRRKKVQARQLALVR